MPIPEDITREVIDSCRCGTPILTYGLLYFFAYRDCLQGRIVLLLVSLIYTMGRCKPGQ